MLKYLLGAAAIFFFILPAHAQTYNTKDNDNLMRDTRRIESAPTEQTATQTQTQQEPVYATETSSGTSSPYADFTGFYVGADVGYAIGSYDVNDPDGADADVGLDGVNGDVFLGYGFEHDMGWLGGYAGVEAGYEWSGADGNLGSTSYEKDHAWQVSFRPGLSMHQDTLGYGIIGYSRAEFEGEGDDENLDGLILGAGAEFDTNTAFKTRLEYTYTNYEDEDIAGASFNGHENNVKLGILFRL